MSGTSRTKTLAATLVATMAALAFSLSGLLDGVASPFRSVVHADPKGIKYLGVGSCAGNGCHNQEIKANKKASDPEIGHDEMSVWERTDMHSRAFLDGISKNKAKAKGLSGMRSKDIAAALKIPEATASNRCTICHTLSGFSNAESKSRIELNYANDVVPDEIAKERFKPAHGVGCDNCHGPSEKYVQPHTAKDWAKKERAASKSGADLFDRTGFYDTKNLQLRANLCVSCHLKIDAELIAAGHPEPAFELDAYCHSGWIHWRPQAAFSGAKVWAMGQFACLREAALQLRERITAKSDPKLIHASYQKLSAHLLMARHPAALIAADLQAALDTQFTAVNDGWSDPAKAGEALRTIGQTADSLAEKLQGMQINKEMAEKLINNLAAEGIVAGVKDYRAAFQYTYAMTSLWESNFLKDEAPDHDRMEIDKKIRETPQFQKNTLLFDEIYDPKKYDPASFVKAVKDVMALYTGGVPLPLPGKEPDSIAKLNEAAIVAARAANGGAAPVVDKAAEEKAAADKAAAEKAAAEKAAADKVAAEKAAAEKVAAEKAKTSEKPEDKAAAEKAAAEKAAAEKVAAEKAAAEKAAADKVAAEKATAEKAAAEKAATDKAAADKVAADKAAAAKNPATGVPGFVFCPRCGQKNSRESNFCLRCGLKLPKLDE